MEQLLALTKDFGLFAVITMYLVYKAVPKIGDWISKIGDTYVQRTVNDVSRVKITKHDLQQHRLFCYLDRAVIYYIDKIEIDNPFKELITKDFLKIKFKTFCDGMHRFVSRDDLMTISADDFETETEKEIVRLVEEYNRKAEEEGIPKLFIEKFAEFHSPVVKVTLEMIQGVCQSKWIEGNDRSAMAVLNILVAAFEMTLVDAERMIKYMNGDLEGLEYKGLVCKAEKH